MRGDPLPHGLPLALWESAFASALASLHSPFVVTLANGTLPKSAFQFYVAQDATFLSSFGDAYKAAINKAHTAGSVLDVKPRLMRLLQGVQEELQLHGSYAAKWGIDLNQGFIPSPATTAYTDFLQAVAHAGDTTVADILAAMAPCSRLYAWLGCMLADAYPGADHQYAEWMETYSSTGYTVLPDIKEGLLHELTRDQPPPAATSSIAAGLRVSLPCTASPSGSAPQQKLSEALVVNFEGCCCQGDAEAAQQQQHHYHHHQHQASEDEHEVMRSQAQVDAFSACLAANRAARLQLLDQLLAPSAMQQQPQQQQQQQQQQRHLQQQPDSLHRENVDGQVDNTAQHASGQGGGGWDKGMGQASAHLDQAGLDRCLERLGEADRERREDLMRASGLLKGVPPEELRRSAQRMSLKQGCKQALRHARSVMHSALSPLLMRLSGGQVQSDSVGASLTHRSVQNLPDRNSVLKGVLSNSDNRKSPGMTVYVGGCALDLKAMLEADCGVMMGEDKAFDRVAACFGVQVRPLFTAPLKAGDCIPGVVYKGKSWVELDVFLFGTSKSGH
ncbi:hypothetical protein DUNSADRAFT_14125 [Dunaliella salina]|uniref:Thiaminase-2/PQQC domain-containing protein n=1 Tax=Dunaliella salina TaxID=3046 RepID=A0ABQ7G845_DUNSA|nr:hypothetical protein DUNSADRAFT_14125 [Dunaliella salina]|eukprot:KAF5830719.1 hypothetical protein DUNSADRAFT_14125 [Dunaliella salina]